MPDPAYTPDLPRMRDAGRQTLEGFARRHYFAAPRFATPEQIECERREIAIDLITDLLHHLRHAGVEADGLWTLCELHYRDEIDMDARASEEEP